MRNGIVWPNGAASCQAMIAARYRGNLRGPDHMQLLRRRPHKLNVRLLDHNPALELLYGDSAVVGARGVDRRTGAGWAARA